MTTKYVDGVIQRNANITAPRRIKVYDDVARPAATIPDAMKAYITEDLFDDGLMRRVRLTCTAVPISVADDAGQAQYGGVKLYTLPEGIAVMLSAVMNGAITMGVTGTIIDAWTGVVALGSATAGTGTTLVTTEATWLQSTAVTTAVAKVAASNAFSIATQLTEAGARWYDGHTTAAPVYLNLAIADDASHTAATGTFTGVIEFVYFIAGDF